MSFMAYYPTLSLSLLQPLSIMSNLILISSWSLEVHISPSSATNSCLLVLGVALFVLAAIIWFLDLKETREDEIERRKAMHILNFDAL